MEEQATGQETAPEPKKRQKWITIYNNSRLGKSVTIHNGSKLMPGKSAKVPLALGLELIERVYFIHRAERGDVLGK